MFLAATLGASVAWTVNYKRYGHRTARFGPFDMTTTVTADNAMDVINKDVSISLGRVEMTKGTDHNFGVMAPGEEGEYTFVVKNVGKGELKLRIGASTCKCTLGSLESESLPPGESTEVKLEWKIEAGSHSTVFSQSAQLLTNDPGNVAINLNIGGKVIGDIEFVPEQWTFGEVAAGEDFVVEGKIYSYFDDKIEEANSRFSGDFLNDKATIEIEPFDPADADDQHTTAKQAFNVRVKLAGGIRQGAVSQNFLFSFLRRDKDGNLVQSGEADDKDDFFYSPVAVTGRIVGALSMIANSRLSGSPGGGYIYDFGRLKEDDDTVGKSYVVLKGNERDNTNLSIGKVEPEGIIKAKLGEPKSGRGTMKLFPLEIEIVRTDTPIALLGNSRDDYGNVWIESDNPKVPKMRIAVKFAVDAK